MFGKSSKSYEYEFDENDENAIGGSYLPPQKLTWKDNLIALAIGLVATLVSYLLASGVRDDSGRFVRVEGATGHGPADAFYESRGRYSPLFTCNTWANAALRRAGAPCCLWTPFPGPILRHAR